MRSERDKDDVLKIVDGQLYIHVVVCPWCYRVTIAPDPTYDLCACGNEFYPVSKLVPLGEPQSQEQLGF